MQKLQFSSTRSKKFMRFKVIKKLILVSLHTNSRFMLSCLISSNNIFAHRLSPLLRSSALPGVTSRRHLVSLLVSFVRRHLFASCSLLFYGGIKNNADASFVCIVYFLGVFILHHPSG